MLLFVIQVLKLWTCEQVRNRRFCYPFGDIFLFFVDFLAPIWPLPSKFHTHSPLIGTHNLVYGLFVYAGG